MNAAPCVTENAIDSGFLRTLWLVAFMEGFSTLAVEVIAIRLAIPLVGSSATLTGIMIAVVLFALSAGYWHGGTVSERWGQQKIRSALARNLLLAGVLYGVLAFPLESLLLDKLLNTGISLWLAIGLTAILLYLAPIYLASQTLPMLAELTNTEGKAGKASGRVLFFSTIGSVAGGVITPVWLFPHLGVTRSTYLVCGVLAMASGIIAVGKQRIAAVAGFLLASIAMTLVMIPFGSAPNALFFFDSAYQTIQITEDVNEDGRPERILSMGGGRASGIYTDTGEPAFKYIQAADRALAETNASTVLAIGAAGFTFPRDAAARAGVTRIDAVDVDPVVKQIAQRDFLKAPLSGKIHFWPLSARFAVRKAQVDGQRYGFALVDAYCGRGIPEELVTVEFFRDLRAISDKVLINVILDRERESAFAKNFLATFRDAFGSVWVQDANPDSDAEITNMMVANWPLSNSEKWQESGVIYRDDRSTADEDHVRMVWKP